MRRSKIKSKEQNFCSNYYLEKALCAHQNMEIFFIIIYNCVDLIGNDHHDDVSKCSKVLRLCGVLSFDLMDGGSYLCLHTIGGLIAYTLLLSLDNLFLVVFSCYIHCLE